MKLTLDYSQRLNLHSLIGAQRATVDDMRLLWKIQDRIDLGAEEKKAINYRVVQAGGQQQVIWDLEPSQTKREFEFNEEEISRLARILKEWQPGFLTTADRVWLEPLLPQFDGHLTKK